MDKASLVPKLEIKEDDSDGGDNGGDNGDGNDNGKDNQGSLVELETAGAAAGMRVASTCIGVPPMRLHSMRQWRKV